MFSMMMPLTAQEERVMTSINGDLIDDDDESVTKSRMIQNEEVDKLLYESSLHPSLEKNVQHET